MKGESVRVTTPTGVVAGKGRRREERSPSGQRTGGTPGQEGGEPSSQGAGKLGQVPRDN